jgi:type VI secretion system protein ImpC
MSTEEQAAGAAEGATTTLEVSEFQDLLNKEFKPKSDRSRDAVEGAVRTLAVIKRYRRHLG